MRNIDANVLFLDDVEGAITAIADDIDGCVTQSVFFDNPTQGIEFLKENKGDNNIVLLDWRFSQNNVCGDKILVEIHNISINIPVIIFTGQAIDVEATKKMFNGHAFACLPKTCSTEEVTKKIEEAYDTIISDISTYVAQWINIQSPERRRVPYVTAAGKSLSLNDLLESIHNGDEIGKEVKDGINKLAIELFMNK